MIEFFTELRLSPRQRARLRGYKRRRAAGHVPGFPSEYAPNTIIVEGYWHRPECEPPEAKAGMGFHFGQWIEREALSRGIPCRVTNVDHLRSIEAEDQFHIVEFLNPNDATLFKTLLVRANRPARAPE